MTTGTDDAAARSRPDFRRVHGSEIPPGYGYHQHEDDGQDRIKEEWNGVKENAERVGRAFHERCGYRRIGGLRGSSAQRIADQ